MALDLTAESITEANKPTFDDSKTDWTNEVFTALVQHLHDVTLANAEDDFTGWMIASRDALTSPVLGSRLRELVVLPTAHQKNSPYEIGQHTGIAEKTGISVEQIAELAPTGAPECADFDDAELAVLLLTMELLVTNPVNAALCEEVRRGLGDEATVEVLMVINRWARVGTDAHRARRRPRLEDPYHDPAPGDVAVCRQTQSAETGADQGGSSCRL